MDDAHPLELAMRRRLLSLSSPGWTVVFQNLDFDEPPPYMVFDLVPTGRSDDTIDGLGPLSEGYVQITIVTLKGSGTREANLKAQQVADHFAYGLRLPIDGGGEITITQPASILGGFPFEANWHRPLRVPFEAS